MTDDRLFDPADYGAMGTERRRRTRSVDSPAIDVVEPWMVLRHLKQAPVAHVVWIDVPPTDRWGTPIATPDVRLAACGAYGMPMRDLGGTSAPACPHCVDRLAKAEKKTA
jgi:hypothetical protein